MSDASRSLSYSATPATSGASASRTDSSTELIEQVRAIERGEIPGRPNVPPLAVKAPAPPPMIKDDAAKTRFSASSRSPSMGSAPATHRGEIVVSSSAVSRSEPEVHKRTRTGIASSSPGDRGVSIDRLSKELKDARDESVRLKRRLDNVAQELRDVKTDRDELSRAYDVLQSAVKDAEARGKLSVDQVKREQDTRVQAYQAELQAHSMRQHQSQQAMSELKKKYDQEIASAQSVEAKLSLVLNQLKEAESRFILEAQSHQQTKTQSIKQTQDLENRLTESLGKYHLLASESNKLQAALTSEVEQLRIRYEVAATKLRSEEQGLQDTEIQIAIYQRDSEVAQKDIFDLRLKLDNLALDYQVQIDQFQAQWLDKYDKKKSALKAADQKVSDLKSEVKELKKEIESLRFVSEIPHVSRSASVTVPALNLASATPVVHSIGTPTGHAADLLSTHAVPQSSDGDSVGDGYASCGAEEFGSPAPVTNPPGLTAMPALAPASTSGLPVGGGPSGVSASASGLPVGGGSSGVSAQPAPAVPGWATPAPSMAPSTSAPAFIPGAQFSVPVIPASSGAPSVVPSVLPPGSYVDPTAGQMPVGHSMITHARSKEIHIPSFPRIGSFKNYLMEIAQQCCAYSQIGDEAEYPWIMECKVKTVDELADSGGPRFATMDNVLAAGLAKVGFPSQVKMDLDEIKERQHDKYVQELEEASRRGDPAPPPRLLKGRQILGFIAQQFKAPQIGMNLFNVSVLMGLEYYGDDRVQSFWYEWVRILKGCREHGLLQEHDPNTEDILREQFVKNLRKSKHLFVDDIKHYDREYTKFRRGEPSDYTYQWLVQRLSDHIEIQRDTKNMRDQRAAIARKAGVNPNSIPAAPAQHVSNKSRKDTRSKSRKPRSDKRQPSAPAPHRSEKSNKGSRAKSRSQSRGKRGKSASRTPAAPAPGGRPRSKSRGDSPARGRSRSKGAGKGKGKGGSRGRSTSRSGSGSHRTRSSGPRSNRSGGSQRGRSNSRSNSQSSRGRSRSSSRSSTGNVLDKEALRKQHCFAHQGHLKGLRGPCPLGDRCFRKHAKEKVSHAEFDKIKAAAAAARNKSSGRRSQPRKGSKGRSKGGGKGGRSQSRGKSQRDTSRDNSVSVVGKDGRRKPRCCMGFMSKGKCPNGKDNAASCSAGVHMTRDQWTKKEKELNA